MPGNEQKSTDSIISHDFVDYIDQPVDLLHESEQMVERIKRFHQLLDTLYSNPKADKREHEDSVYSLCRTIWSALSCIPAGDRSSLCLRAIKLIEHNLSSNTFVDSQLRYTALRAGLYSFIADKKSDTFKAACLLNMAQEFFNKSYINYLAKKTSEAQATYKKACDLYLASHKLQAYPFCKEMFRLTFEILHPPAQPNPHEWINKANKAFKNGEYKHALAAYKIVATIQYELIKNNPRKPALTYFPIPEILSLIKSAEKKDEDYYAVSQDLLEIIIKYTEVYLLEHELLQENGNYLLEKSRWLHDSYRILSGLQKEYKSNEPMDKAEQGVIRTQCLLDGLIAHKEKRYKQAYNDFKKAQGMGVGKIYEHLIACSSTAIELELKRENACSDLLNDLDVVEKNKIAKNAELNAAKENDAKRRAKQSAEHKQRNWHEANRLLKEQQEKHDQTIQRRNELRKSREEQFKQEINQKQKEEKVSIISLKNLIINLPTPVLKTAKEMECGGKYKVVIGGGAVTCRVMAILDESFPEFKDSDIDLYTSMTPEEIENFFGSNCIKMKKLEAKGIHAYRIKDSNPPIEVVYSSNLDNLKDNAMARDCVQKALFADAEGRVIDPLEAIKFLQKGIYQTIKNPLDSFTEDPSRILRAITDHFKFGWILTPEIKKAITKTAGGLTSYLNEKEIDVLDVRMKKLFDDGCFLKEKFNLLCELNVIGSLFPELEKKIDEHRVWIEKILSTAKDYKTDSLTLLYLSVLTACKKNRTDINLIFKHLYVNNYGRHESVRAIPNTINQLILSLMVFEKKHQELVISNSPYSLFHSAKTLCSHSDPQLQPNLWS